MSTTRRAAATRVTDALRLLYLLPGEGFGGAERQGLYHLAELPKHGVEVTALVGPGEPIVGALRAAGVEHELFGHFPDRSHARLTPVERARYGASWFRAFRRTCSDVERRVEAEPFDLIFANRTYAWLVAASVGRKLGIPYVLRAGSRPAHPLLGPALTLLDRAAPPVAAFYNCGAVERSIGEHLRCKGFPLPNAIDFERFTPGPADLSRERLGLPVEGPLIGLAARPAPEKGFDLLERLVARVRAESPRARFVVAGEFGWRASYETRFRAAGLGEAVLFLGHVEAMPDFFRAMDVIILTSRARSIEASPNALLEAMATERPIVATAVGGVPELLVHAHEGFLVGEGDDARFAAHILELLRAPSLREGFGHAGRARALSRHDMSAVVGRLAHDLREIACTSTRRFTAPAIFSSKADEREGNRARGPRISAAPECA